MMVDQIGGTSAQVFRASAMILGGVAAVLFLRARRKAGDSSTSHKKVQMDKDTLFSARRKLFCAAQSVSYANTSPLVIMQGRGQYLVDADGVEYLDTRNNVGHVGWQHPAVVRAVQLQMERTNTNTRYLHPSLVMLGQRLLAKMPKELCRVFFVNSGSEANDLALRLARAHTGHHDAVVVEHAYHGHTVAALALSPYKFLGKGGEGRPEWVQVAACPDTYRGPHRGADAAERYAREVEAACRRVKVRGPGWGVAAFFIESGMSVGGVILPPPGYLERAYAHVRAAGGVCVADEVQVGFGRFGKHFWGFQQQGVVPDIVTMGKPAGNGVPLAAVCCTEAVARSFSATKMEYFNTFGGNPVSCAAGLAVLDTIEGEGLAENAATVGAHLRTRLTELGVELEAAGARVLVGDVRGSGLFMGIDLVSNLATRSPATKAASVLCSRLLRVHHILTSLDGPADNVIVIKPPLCFSTADADRLVGALRSEALELTDAVLDSASHTPT